ncbi:hypothetical protein CEXT_168871 [Caerostris extrusa]|uniref:Uncharacterized protein n=1 Tax=Caerostris extrusa TaxID=172846 RepID=A0AAV4P9B5_CAEEX|nr:hypothetical protein CEXT_168871 [Caerostris extrusa]
MPDGNGLRGRLEVLPLLHGKTLLQKSLSLRYCERNRSIYSRLCWVRSGLPWAVGTREISVRLHRQALRQSHGTDIRRNRILIYGLMFL